jgi:hypothetical protein
MMPSSPVCAYHLMKIEARYSIVTIGADNQPMQTSLEFEIRTQRYPQAIVSQLRMHVYRPHTADQDHDRPPWGSV